VRKSIQINCSPDAVYKFWRDFQNLPKFMSNVESVETLSDKRSHWCVRGPAGKRIEWDAEITGEQENRLIAWRSLEGAQVENYGTIRFEPLRADAAPMSKSICNTARLRAFSALEWRSFSGVSRGSRSMRICTTSNRSWRPEK
jgi:uncharacterized membrane protein